MYTDIRSGAILESLPAWLQAYAVLARLDRPIGWWLLLIPSLWSIALAAGGSQNIGFWELYLAGLFFFGAIVMRAAGCVINDLWDRDLDAQVERTSVRPLASGDVQPWQGLIFLTLLLLAGLLILIQMNWFTVILGLISLPLIITYPLMKRITYYPQAFLGVTFNFGALMGWSAVTGLLELTPVLLYLAGILWTLGYDTIYAHQDKEDDLMAGIKSTALRFEEHSKKYVAGFMAGSFALILLALGTAPLSTLSILCLTGAGLHLLWQIWAWNPDAPQSSLDIFKSNKIFGLIVLFACLL